MHWPIGPSPLSLGRILLGLFADRAVKLCQTEIGFSGDRTANDCGKFVDASTEPLRHEEPRQEIFEMRSIDFAEFLHRHDSFKKAVLPQPRMPDAGAFALRGGAQHEISAPGHIEVPGNKT